MPWLVCVRSEHIVIKPLKPILPVCLAIKTNPPKRSNEYYSHKTDISQEDILLLFRKAIWFIIPSGVNS